MKRPARPSLFLRRIIVPVLLVAMWLLSLSQQTPPPPAPDSPRAAAAAAADWPVYREQSVKIAEQLYDRQEYAAAKAILRETLEVLTAHDQGESVEAGKVWGWLALVSRRQELYTEAFEAYQQAIRRYEKQQYRGANLPHCYKNAAQICTRWNNYRLANDYLQAALLRDTTGKLRLSIYSQLANNYYWQDSLAAARRYYELGLSLADDNSTATAALWSVGSALLVKTDGDLGAARALAQRALDFYQAKPDQNENRLRSFITLADIAARQGRRAEAEEWFRKAEAFGKTCFLGKSREMAILYQAWGDFYEKNGAAPAALNFYQKAIIQVFPGFDQADLAANPPTSEAHIESQAMFALACKGAALLKKNGLTPADRANAADCFELSFAVAAKLRQTYGDDADKLSLAGENRGYQRLAARNLWQLWQTRQDSATLTRLFRLIEQSKAQALADAVRQQRALVLSDIPDSLLAREQRLRLGAADATLLLRNTALRGDQSDSLARLQQQEQAFRANRAYADFLRDLAGQYPRFQQFTAEELPVDPRALRAALPDSAALLSWFDAGDRYLCIVVRPAGLSAFEVLRDSVFDRRLGGFLARLADKSAQEKAPNEYFSEAFALGQALLPADLLAAARSLVIAPDGRLCYLPFEALLTASHHGSFGSAPYLLRTHTLRYTWLAGLLTARADSRLPTAMTFLHVAPFVETARDGLAPLPGSRRERPAGVAVTELFGKTATAGAFLDQCAQYKILQLSTHAHAGGTAQPGIELYDRTLLLPEIYAQRLPTALVALSACETGAGEYAEGEGVLSLARAFAYAGAESLLASHWAVNERSTAELFTHFYQKLESGAARAEALRQAKLDWLAGSDADARKAPWYWAAFTLSGADGPVDFSEKPGRAWWWAVAAMAVAIGLAFWRRKRMVK